MKGGDRLRLHHRELEGQLEHDPITDALVVRTGDDSKVRLRVASRTVPTAQRVTCQLLLPMQVRSSSSLFQIELEDERHGTPLQWGQHFRLRHLATGTLVRVSRDQVRRTPLLRVVHELLCSRPGCPPCAAAWRRAAGGVRRGGLRRAGIAVSAHPAGVRVARRARSRNTPELRQPDLQNRQRASTTRTISPVPHGIAAQCTFRHTSHPPFGTHLTPSSPRVAAFRPPRHVVIAPRGHFRAFLRESARRHPWWHPCFPRLRRPGLGRRRNAVQARGPAVAALCQRHTTPLVAQAPAPRPPPCTRACLRCRGLVSPSQHGEQHWSDWRTRRRSCATCARVFSATTRTSFK